MTLRTLRHVPSLRAIVVSLAAVGMAACASVPRVDSVAVQRAGKQSAARVAAVQEMRIRAAAAESGPYPDVFANAAAGAPNPAPMSEVAATEDHLAALSHRQPRVSAAALRAGEARTANLRRLGRLRYKQAEQAIQAASKKP